MAIQTILIPASVVIAFLGLLTNKSFLTFIGLIALAILALPLIISLLPGLAIGLLISKIPWYVWIVGILIIILLISKKK